MELDLDTPQRVVIAIEKNKSDTWTVSASLITADGQRGRRSLGMFETYRDAARAIKKVWRNVSL